MPSAEYTARVEKVARRFCADAGFDPNQPVIDLSRGARCVRGDIWYASLGELFPAWCAFIDDAKAALRATSDD